MLDRGGDFTTAGTDRRGVARDNHQIVNATSRNYCSSIVCEIAAALSPMSEHGVGDLHAAHSEAQRKISVGNLVLLFESDDGLMIAVAVNFYLVQFRNDLFERNAGVDSYFERDVVARSHPSGHMRWRDARSVGNLIGFGCGLFPLIRLVARLRLAGNVARTNDPRKHELIDAVLIRESLDITDRHFDRGAWQDVRD